jgi:hypothetical protein
MRLLDAAELTAIRGRVVVKREFAWITAKTRDPEPAPVAVGFWSDAGRFTCEVKDGLSGTLVERTFNGAEAVQFPDVSLISDISVRTADLVLSGIGAAAEATLRTNECRSAPIQIYRGFFDPETMLLVAPPKPRFIGFVDEAPIFTAAAGGMSTITMSCASHTRELLRKNADVRSHESQIKRAPGDTYLKDVNVVGDWDIAWGEHRQRVGSASNQNQPDSGVFFGASN